MKCTIILLTVFKTGCPETRHPFKVAAKRGDDKVKSIFK